ncbi:MFS transporter [Pseudodesulfovibrio portus]|uniref:FAD:protein FMN transferase n=1 Tax=Pseudodesulfovibrio portus TaxID=231439 RepID=A0ABM8APL9_9BACT|nr:MFS transporter [Pseudodesulfovibrio portus]BDQ33362.1 hypothetical protein JCM14722_09040 [Pseudodesulfovibrio portus]
MQTRETTRSRTGDFRILAAILAGGLFSALGVGLFSFTIPLVSMDERISGAWLGSAFAAYYLAKLIVSPLSGMAADRFGPRPVLLLGMCAGCLIPPLYFLLPGLKTLYAIQIAMGLVSGLIRPVGMATLGSAAAGTNLTRWFAAQSALFSLAAFAGPIVGSLLYFNRSMAPVLIGLAACMGAALLATLFLLPGKTVTHRRDTVEPPAPDYCSKEKTTALLLAIGGRTLGIGLLTAFYPILLVDTLGRHGPTVAATYAVPGLATFLGLSLSGRFSTRKPDLDRVVFGMLLSAGSLFVLGSCTQLWQFVTFGAIMGGGAALSIPASMALASSYARRQGAVFGAANFASGVGFLLGPLLGGLIVQHYHSPLPAMQTAAALGGLACLPLVTITLREHFHWGTALSRSATGICSVTLLVIMAVCLSPRTDIESPGKGLYRFTDVAMGTIVNLTLEAKSRGAAAVAARKTMSAMRALQQDFDHRNLDGSIGRINRNAGLSWIKPTPRAFALLERTLEYSDRSGGVFDPTIGALTTSPLYYALDKTLAHAKSGLVDYRLVLVDRPGKRVRLKKKGMALDLGGIAKGTIVDAGVAFLRKQGIPSGIVEAGGDFYCFGDRDWTVGIRHPRNSASLQTISVREKGVCGSGDYQQFVTTEENGKPVKRHHIINPATMESAQESIGVTVIADSAEKADVLATTLFIMGPTQGTGFLAEHSPDSAAIWFLPDHTAAITDNFPH